MVLRVRSSRELQWFLVGVVLLSVCLAGPLGDWIWLARKREDASHVVLIPIISMYLLWQRRGEWAPFRRSAVPAAILAILGVACVALGWGGQRSVLRTDNTALVWSMLGYVLWVLALGCWFLGGAALRRMLFPTLFLFLMVPGPTKAMLEVSEWLQHASAEAASLFFQVTGTTCFREGTRFLLPGIVLEVAEECSGVRSTMVLLIISALAANTMLRSPWRQAALIAVSVPIGILRNGFRVLVLGLLCVYVDPSMIESWVHHQGGPFFFVVSLVPLFGLLLWLKRAEDRRGAGLTAED